MFPGVSKSARSSLVPLFDEKIREERRRPTHPTLSPTYRISVGCRSLSLSLFFPLDEVIDIFHEKNRRIHVNILTAIGLSKGENFRSKIICRFNSFNPQLLISFGVVFPFRWSLKFSWFRFNRENWFWKLFVKIL